MGVELVMNRVSNSLTSCYRSASKHPLFVFNVFVLIWTYRSFPFLFSLLVDASPVIASTFVLLGFLLFYGNANALHIQKEVKSHNHDVNLVSGGIGNTEIDEKTIGSCVSRGNRRLSQDGRSELGNRRPFLANRGGQFPHFESGNRKLRSNDGSRRSSFDPSHSVLGDIDDDIKGWESGSDVLGRPSLSGSMAEIFPLPDEHHPLLDSDVPFGSGEMIHDTNDYDDDDEDHDDIEVRDDDDDDEDESFLRWTEDDQRNLMNFGTLELERNQRLESLIARQRAIKNMRMLAQKSMVNISPDVRFMDTHISSARNTASELPNHSHDNILGSAPSNIMPRRNPFDPPYDPRGGKHRVGHSALGTYSLPEKIGSEVHQVAEGDDRSNEVKIGGENTGYEAKTFNKSNSSSFFDVTDGGDDNDNANANAKEEHSSADSEDQQDSEDSDSEEEGLTQRLKSWLLGW